MKITKSETWDVDFVDKQYVRYSSEMWCVWMGESLEAINNRTVLEYLEMEFQKALNT